MINKYLPFFQRVSTTLTSRPFLCQRKPTAAKTSLFLPEDQWRTCFTECVNRTTFLTWWRTPRVSAIIMHTAIVQPVLLTTAQHPLVYLANFFFIYFIKVYLDFLLFSWGFLVHVRFHGICLERIHIDIFSLHYVIHVYILFDKFQTRIQCNRGKLNFEAFSNFE